MRKGAVDKPQPSETPRKREADRKYFRSPRTLLINERWYYQSRENPPEGPFTTREDAEEAVSRYVQLVNSPLFEEPEMDRINSLSV